MFVGWLACYVLTATGVFSSSPGGFGHASRTDRHAYVLAESPWFRVPYPGTVHVQYRAVHHVPAYLPASHFTLQVMPD